MAYLHRLRKVFQILTIMKCMIPKMILGLNWHQCPVREVDWLLPPSVTTSMFLEVKRLTEHLKIMKDSILRKTFGPVKSQFLHLVWVPRQLLLAMIYTSLEVKLGTILEEMWKYFIPKNNNA